MQNGITVNLVWNLYSLSSTWTVLNFAKLSLCIREETCPWGWIRRRWTFGWGCAAETLWLWPRCIKIATLFKILNNEMKYFFQDWRSLKPIPCRAAHTEWAKHRVPPPPPLGCVHLLTPKETIFHNYMEAKKQCINLLMKFIFCSSRKYPYPPPPPPPPPPWKAAKIPRKAGGGGGGSKRRQFPRVGECLVKGFSRGSE